MKKILPWIQIVIAVALVGFGLWLTTDESMRTMTAGTPAAYDAWDETHGNFFLQWRL